MSKEKHHDHPNFYPRPPRGGRRFLRRPVDKASNISIHALREEGDILILRVRLFFFYFYPRPPRGGRRSLTIRRAMTFLFLSTPSARRATRAVPNLYGQQPKISIHALREEGDATCKFLISATNAFLSTPSARRATTSKHAACLPLIFLSTPSARRATDHRRRSVAVHRISIHALREEGDNADVPKNSGQKRFLSTPSARRATPV